MNSQKSITHPALICLKFYGQKIPGIWDALNANRVRHGHTPQSDPVGHDFIDTVAGMTGLSQRIQDWNISQQQQLTVYAALAAWRYTLGIYRFDPSVYEAVCDTPLTGDIPVDVLRQMPEWVNYIETPGLTAPGSSGKLEDILGAWVRVVEMNATPVMCIYTHTSTNPDHIDVHQLHLTRNLSDMFKEAIAHTGRHLLPEETMRSDVGYLRAIINLSLYLCSQASEIAGRDGAHPGNPAPIATRRSGMKLFAANGPATWEVGVRLGAALRHAYHVQEMADGRAHSGPVPHIRRAHWHGFRMGPMKTIDGQQISAEKRKFELRWLPPIPVNICDFNQLQATIRPVK